MNATVVEGASGSMQQRHCSTAPIPLPLPARASFRIRFPRAILINGLVNAQGIFVGSSTENPNGYNDLFIAAPLNNPLPTASTFKGSYSLAYMDLSTGNPANTLGAMVSMNPDGAGNLGTVGVAGYVGQGGSSKVVQSLANVKYIFSGGAGVVTFPNSNTAAFTGQYYLYFSPDGNFVFGGSPVSVRHVRGSAHRHRHAQPQRPVL